MHKSTKNIRFFWRDNGRARNPKETAQSDHPALRKRPKCCKTLSMTSQQQKQTEITFPGTDPV